MCHLHIYNRGLSQLPTLVTDLAGPSARGPEFLQKRSNTTESSFVLPCSRYVTCCDFRGSVTRWQLSTQMYLRSHDLGYWLNLMQDLVLFWALLTASSLPYHWVDEL